MIRFNLTRWLTKHYGEGEGDGDGSQGAGVGSGTGTGGAGGGTGAGGTGEIKFTPEQQKHIDKLINTRFAKQKSENETLVKQLETIKQRADMTAQEKAQIESQIERLKTEHMSKEEIQQREYKTSLDRLSSEAKAANESAAKSKTLLEKYVINAELTNAASAAKAYRSSQIVSMFTGSSKVVPQMDAEGKPIPDAFQVKMTLNLDGKALEVTPAEAMKLLKESADYANLFAGEGNGGLGNNGQSKTGEIDAAQIQKWMESGEEYTKHRTEIMAYLAKQKGTK